MIMEDEMKKLTLGFKKSTCQYCKSCDKKAMRQGRPFCNSEYKPRSGHCENFSGNKEVTQVAKA